MKISIYGAGAVGGVLGAVLAKQGHEVGLIARGDHLAAMKANGCTLESDDDRFTVHPACSDNPADFGPQDFVIVTVKASNAFGGRRHRIVIGADYRCGYRHERRAMVVFRWFPEKAPKSRCLRSIPTERLRCDFH